MMQAETKLTIMPVFENLTIPLTEKQEDELAASLIREGCINPIDVWEGTILDGHKRYRICTLEQIEFSVQEVECKTEEEAISWVCRKRIEGLSRTSQAFRYLMGKWYLSEVIINRSLKKPRAPAVGNYYERRGNRTSIQMSKETGLHHSTLEKYGSYATALDVLIRIEPELLNLVMSGDILLSQEETLELSHMEDKDRREGIRRFLRQASKRAKSRYIKDDRKAEKQAEEANHIPLSIGIKEMPVFNPDMELQGLTLTMPTWMMAMERAIRRSDMTQVTEDAKEDLRSALGKLEEQIKMTLEALS